MGLVCLVKTTVPYWEDFFNLNPFLDKSDIETCKKAGKEPQKAFKGLFPARINPEIHKKAALVALQRKISLNKLVELAIEHEIEASH